MLQRETAKSAAETKDLLKKEDSGVTEAGAGFRAGAGIGFRIPLKQAATRYGQMLPIVASLRNTKKTLRC